MPSPYVQPERNSTGGPETIASFYEQLFSDRFFVFEDEQPYFQEKLLQAIWNEQLVQAELTTEQGDPLRIVHPGIWNVEAGPDFHDAVIHLAGRTLRGPIELHLRPESWHHHGHQHNPDYDQVILHVVWQNPAAHRTYPASVPLLSLAGQLKRPLPEIMEKIDLSAYPYARQVQAGQCADQLADLSDAFLRDLFQSYGVARILHKAQALCRDIQAEGLEQATYRQFLDIMGYKNNRQAFAELAQQLPPDSLQGASLDTTLAVFFGTAGLLPDPTRTELLPRHQDRVQRLWRGWWSRRTEHRPIEWNRHRLRPFNAPERRLAGAALLLHHHDFKLGQQLIETINDEPDPATCLRDLRDLFVTPEQDSDADWGRFLSFSQDLSQPAKLIGDARTHDLLVNLAVPLHLAWCLLQNRPDACQRGKRLLAAMPRLQSNRLFKEAIHYFFVPPSRARTIITNACAQQGLLKLYRDWNQAS